MAMAYRDAGFAVVIDDFWDSNQSADCQDLKMLPNLHKILLYPEQAKAHRRNFQRSGDSPARGYIDEGIRIVYQQLGAVFAQLVQDDWLVVDTTVMSVDDTVTSILQSTGV